MSFVEYDKITDDELVELFRNGDQLAFDQILARYKGLISYITKDSFIQGAEKEDLIQEGYIGLYKAMRDYDKQKEASFKSFADLCIQRQVNSAIKMADRKKHKPLNLYTSLDQKYSDDGDEDFKSVMDLGGYVDPLESTTSRAVMDIFMKRAQKELSDFEFKVFELNLQEIPYLEIAQILKKDPKSVDNALQRTRKKLAKIIDDIEKKD